MVVSRALLVAFLTPLAASAQDPARPRTDSVPALQPVTVTATRTESSILTAPLAITKVTTPELRNVSGLGLDDALRKVPGVIAQSRYGTSDVRLTIRGFGARGAGDRSNAGTSRGVRVLLDGIPETEPDGRTAFDNIDLAAAEAVEVIRSNASSVWGNAAGGVINVLTAPDKTAPTFELQPIFGGFGLRRYAVRAMRPLQSGAAYARFTNTEFEGWRKHSSARRALVNAGVSGTLGSATDFGFFATAANNLMHLPGPLTLAEFENDPTRANATYVTRDERRYNRTVRIGGTIDHEINDRASFSAMLFANPKYLQRSERGTFRDFTRYHLGGNAVARVEVPMGAATSRFSLGVDEAYQDGAILFYSLTPEGTRGTTLTDNKGEGANNLGIFLQDEIEITERARALLGARWDKLSYYYQSFLPTPPVRRDTRDFSRVTPKIGISYLVMPTVSLYANVGGGVEIPAGNETDPAPGQPPALLNPLLEPIRSTTAELGAKSISHSIGSVNVGFDAALYRTRVTNEIVPYNGGRFYFTAGRATRRGAELGVHADSRSGVFGAVALTASRNRYDEYVVDSAYLGRAGFTANYSGNEVVGVPDATAHAEIGYALPFARGVRVTGTMEHMGSYFADDANTVRIPSYTISGLGVELREPLAIASGWGLTGFARVHNLRDRVYVGSAFLNPDRVGGAPAVYEPGQPRTFIFSLSIGRK